MTLQKAMEEGEADEVNRKRTPLPTIIQPLPNNDITIDNITS